MPDQFVVPQFIDVEDKIFGPVTTRQFIILLAGGLLVFIAYKFADLALFAVILALVGGFSLVLAFVKINGQPFHYFLLNIFQTLRRPSLRVWNSTPSKEELKYLIDNQEIAQIEAVKVIPRVSYNRIRDLSLIVNTGGYYRPDQEF